MQKSRGAGNTRCASVPKGDTHLESELIAPIAIKFHEVNSANFGAQARSEIGE